MNGLDVYNTITQLAPPPLFSVHLNKWLFAALILLDNELFR